MDVRNDENSRKESAETSKKGVSGHAEKVEAVLVKSENDNKKEPDKPKYNFPLWASVFAIVGIYLAAMLIGTLVKVVIEKTAHADSGFANFMGYTTALTITIIFSVWLLIARGAKRPLMKFSLKNSGPSLILWGVILVLVTSVVIEPFLALFPDKNIDLLKQITTTGGWAMLTTVMVAPILEELLFRGIVQEHVTREYGAVRGILLASLIFALAHITVPQQAVNAFFVGLILGYMYFKTNSLLPVIIIHAINNAIAYIMMSLLDDGVVTLRDVVDNDVVYWVLYALCAVILLISCINVVSRLKKQKTAVVSK